MVYEQDFERMLRSVGTQELDFIPLKRIAGFMEMAGKVKRLQVKKIMERIMDRAAMRARKEKETFENIARFMDERDMKLEECFKYFETDQDGFISTEELRQGLLTMKIPLN
jgi:Ca2+-binding EF-hand superfamily protein